MINLSFRQVLHLAHSCSISVTFIPYSNRHLRIGLRIDDLRFISSIVSISYAKKWFPLIMGENFYRNSLLFKL